MSPIVFINRAPAGSVLLIAYHSHAIAFSNNAHSIARHFNAAVDSAGTPLRVDGKTVYVSGTGDPALLSRLRGMRFDDVWFSSLVRAEAKAQLSSCVRVSPENALRLRSLLDPVPPA